MNSYCIWRSTSVQYVQIERQRELWPRKWFLWVEIRVAKHVDRCSWKCTRVWSHQLTSDLKRHSITFLMKPFGETSNFFLYWHLKRSLLFWKCLQWSCWKAVLVPSFVLGGLRGSPRDERFLLRCVFVGIKPEHQNQTPFMSRVCVCVGGGGGCKGEKKYFARQYLIEWVALRKTPVKVQRGHWRFLCITNCKPPRHSTIAKSLLLRFVQSFRPLLSEPILREGRGFNSSKVTLSLNV